MHMTLTLICAAMVAAHIPGMLEGKQWPLALGILWAACTGWVLAFWFVEGIK